MDIQEMIEQHGCATKLYVALERSELFTWQGQMYKEYGDAYACEVTTWEFHDLLRIPIYACVLVLMLKRSTMAPEAALTAVSSALAAMHIQKMLDAGHSIEIPSLGLVLKKEPPHDR